MISLIPQLHQHFPSTYCLSFVIGDKFWLILSFLTLTKLASIFKYEAINSNTYSIKKIALIHPGPLHLKYKLNKAISIFGQEEMVGGREGGMRMKKK